MDAPIFELKVIHECAMSVRLKARRLDRSPTRPRPASQPPRQEEQCPNEVEQAAHGEAEDSERQQQEPDQRRKDQYHQGQGPAQHQQDAPEKERGHGRASGIQVRAGTGTVPAAIGERFSGAGGR